MTNSQANPQRTDAFRIIIRLGLFSLLLAVLISIEIAPLIRIGLRTGELLPIPYVIQEQARDEEIIIYGVPWQRDALIMYKLQSVIAHQPEIMVMGSSRMAFFQEQAFIDGQQTFYNAHIEGASTAEQLQVMTYLAEHDALPEILILGLDIARFNLQLNSIGETAHAIVPYYRMQADYYLSRLSKMPNQISQFENASSTVNNYRLIGSLALSSYYGFINDGSRIRFNMTPEVALASHRSLFEERLQTYTPGSEVNLQTIENIHSILEIMAENDVEVVGVLSPYHADFWQEMVASEDYTYIEPSLEALQNLFDSYGYPLFDYSDVSQLTDDNEMWDGWHPSALLSTRIVQDIAEQTTPLMDDYVDYEALETIIANADDPFFVFYDFNFEDFPN